LLIAEYPYLHHFDEATTVHYTRTRYSTGRKKMALESFYETMVIDTPEAGANLAKAIERYEKYGPYVPGPVQGTTDDPEDLDKFMGVSP
jgi:hypothetical protein